MENKIVLCLLLFLLHFAMIKWYPEGSFLRGLKVFLYFAVLIILGIAMRRIGK